MQLGKISFVYPERLEGKKCSTSALLYKVVGREAGVVLHASVWEPAVESLRCACANIEIKTTSH